MKTMIWIINLLALSCMLPALSGCTLYMKTRYGAARPAEETPAALLAFLQKNHFPVSNQYMFSDSGTFCRELTDPEFRKYLLSHLTFDRYGTLLQRDTTKCQWSGFDQIRALHPDSAYAKKPGIRLDRILREITPFGPGATDHAGMGDPDFTVVVTWAKFIGRYNARLFVLDSAVRINHSAKIRTIWLNVDMQEAWKLPESRKMKIR